MNSDDFISQLSAKTGIDTSQATQMNSLFSDSSLLDNAGKDKITQMIVEKIGVDEQQANQIYDVAMNLLKDSLLDKINPFKK